MDIKRSKSQIGGWISSVRFRRIVTSNRFIPEVDGFRFLAILIVIFSHVYVQGQSVPTAGRFASFFHSMFSDGYRGVYLFFTISGFILALPFARHYLQDGNRVNLKSYFRRRLTRLEPPYILVMVGRFFLLILYNIKHLAITVLLLHLISSLFYVNNLIYMQSPIINPPAWSLEIEIQFYILAPALAVFFTVRNKFSRRFLLLALIVCADLFAARYINPSQRLSLTLLNYLQYFLAGFVLADFYITDDLPRLSPFLWDAAGLGALIWILAGQSPSYLLVLPFVSLMLYMAGFKGYIVRHLFAFAPISAIGGMCYSLYLTHSTVLTFMMPLVHRAARLYSSEVLQLAVIFIPCLLAVLLVGGVFYLLIEQPCMAPDWPNRLAMRLRGAS